MILELYTVYKNPSDYPGLFVVRRFNILPGEEAHPEQVPVFVGKDLIAIQEELIQMGLTRLERQPDDEPQIVETWI